MLALRTEKIGKCVQFVSFVAIGHKYLHHIVYIYKPIIYQPIKCNPFACIYCSLYECFQYIHCEDTPKTTSFLHHIVEIPRCAPPDFRPCTGNARVTLCGKAKGDFAKNQQETKSPPPEKGRGVGVSLRIPQGSKPGNRGLGPRIRRVKLPAFPPLPTGKGEKPGHCAC